MSKHVDSNIEQKPSQLCDTGDHASPSSDLPPVQALSEAAPPAAAGADHDVLARLESMPLVLAQVTDVLQAKEALTAAKVIEAYVRGKKIGEEILRLAFRFKAQAKRRLGEMLLQAKEDGRLYGGRPQKTVDYHDRFLLADWKVSKDESAQAQAYAVVPAADFDEMVESSGLSDTALWRAVSARKLAQAQAPARKTVQRRAKPAETATAVPSAPTELQPASTPGAEVPADLLKACRTALAVLRKKLPRYSVDETLHAFFVAAQEEVSRHDT
jgi:hypothetical protein